MNDCYQLKREIEDVIYHGYLSKYVRKGATWPNVPNPSQWLALPKVDNRSTEKEVDMISWRTRHSSKRPRGEGRDENVNSFFNKDLVRVYNVG